LDRILAAPASLLNTLVVISGRSGWREALAMQILVPTTPHLVNMDGTFTDPTRIRGLADKVDLLEEAQRRRPG
jgi:hypothetical protein